jgi:hypothetical protein
MGDAETTTVRQEEIGAISLAVIAIASCCTRLCPSSLVSTIASSAARQNRLAEVKKNEANRREPVSFCKKAVQLCRFSMSCRTAGMYRL